MSTLTKVFVVLLAVFSVAFTSMTVSHVAQTTNWKDTAEKYREHAGIADTNLRHAHAAYSAQLANARDDAKALSQKIGDLEGQVAGAAGELAQVRSQLATLTAEKSSADAMNRGLLAQLQTAEAARTEYRKQRDELEQHGLEREQRSIDLNNRVNELTAQVDVLLEQKRQYEQQINILQTENQKLSLGGRAPSARPTFESPEGAALPDVVALSPMPTRAVRGRVVEIAGELVTISVGSSDGVKKEMLFVIHRNGEYVGDLRIEMTDPNQSAGRIVRASKTPQKGDDITDAASMVSASK